MRGTFVRGIWGDITKNGIRDGKMRRDIDAIKNNAYNEPFVVYVFGRENFNVLMEEGFESVLIDEEPVRYDMSKQLYRHKLDIIEKASADLGEIIFLDWDCVPTAPLPQDFWDKMKLKAPFQANLFQYRTKKCLWRDCDWRKVCNGGFLYLREPQIAIDFQKNYKELLEWVEEKRRQREAVGKALRFREEALMFDDEPAITKWVDDFMGGWKGKEEYWDKFEPDFCNLRKKSAYPMEMLKGKHQCFLHWG